MCINLDRVAWLTLRLGIPKGALSSTRPMLHSGRTQRPDGQGIRDQDSASPTAGGSGAIVWREAFGYGLAFCCVAVAFGVRLLLSTGLDGQSAFLFFTRAVVVAGAVAVFGPGSTPTALSLRLGFGFFHHLPNTSEADFVSAAASAAIGLGVSIVGEHLCQQTEARLRKFRSELIHVSRLTAMGEMASALTHELNQPLSAIANYLRRIGIESDPGGGTVFRLTLRAAGSEDMVDAI
jgi:hypothetical protein